MYRRVIIGDRLWSWGVELLFPAAQGAPGGLDYTRGHRRWQTQSIHCTSTSRDTCSQYQYSFLIFNCDDNKSSSSPQSILRGCRWSRKNRKKHTSSPAQLHSAQLHTEECTDHCLWTDVKLKHRNPNALQVQLDRTRISIVMEEHALQIDKKGQMRLVKQNCLFSPQGLGWVGATTGNGSKIAAS